jgi:chromate transporter
MTDDRPLPPVAPAPGPVQLFAAFAKIALSGFGGVIAWSRRILVEERGWLTPQEFNEVLALCQVLPGPNIVNVSVVLGARWAGLPGALAALFGLIGPPMLLMIGAGLLYRRYGEVPELRGMLAGLAAAAAGQIAATAAQMAEPMARTRFGPGQLVAIATFIAAGLMRLPLLGVMAVMLPIAIAGAWWERRRS